MMFAERYLGHGCFLDGRTSYQLLCQAKDVRNHHEHSVVVGRQIECLVGEALILQNISIFQVLVEFFMNVTFGGVCRQLLVEIIVMLRLLRY